MSLDLDQFDNRPNFFVDGLKRVWRILVPGFRLRLVKKILVLGDENESILQGTEIDRLRLDGDVVHHWTIIPTVRQMQVNLCVSLTEVPGPPAAVVYTFTSSMTVQESLQDLRLYLQQITARPQ